MTKLYTIIKQWLILSRFDKPAPFWLITLPTFWGLTIAHQGLPPVKDLIIFLTGAILMRGAGCTINDIWDKDFDCQVLRTASRPLATGEISIRNAFLWFCIQLLLGSFLLLFMNRLVFFMAFLAIFLMVIYPLMKRITYWPQVFLGIAWNYPMLMAYAYVTETLNMKIIILYMGSIIWTVAYDTIYAHQDKIDDIKVGIKSSALFLQDNTRIFVCICYILFITSVVLSAEITIYTVFPLLFYISLLCYQIIILNIDSPSVCGKIFSSNRWVAVCVWIVLLLSNIA